jgi:hypothetical protein
MDQPRPSQHPVNQRVGHPLLQGEQRLPVIPHIPPAPPMQIITKGWWPRPDEEATADELQQADDLERAGR